MKKWIIGISVTCSLLISGVAIGETLNGSYNGNPIVKVLAGGKTITDEIPAQVIDGKTMVPLTLLRQLGAKVDWNQDAYSVTVTMPEKVKVVVPKLSHDQLNVIGKSVGLISSYQGDTAMSHGSGFMLDNHVFVTCHHVIEGADKIRVDMDGKTYWTNEKVFDDKDHDIAGYRLNADVPALKVTTALPEKNDIVHSLGFPHGQRGISDGVVYSTLVDLDNVKKIVHSANTEPGSSGGVLMSDSGEVVGITSAGNSNIELAITMQYVQDDLARLK